MSIAEAYRIPGLRIANHSQLDKRIARALADVGPTVSNVEITPEQTMEPKLVFGRPIEDSSPLLPREEFRANMIVEPVEVS